MLAMMLPAAELAASTTTCNGNQCTVSDGNSDFSVSYNSDEVGLFGEVMLSNNTIFFLPDQFFAESMNGDNGPLVTDTLNLLLTPTTSGFTFDSFFMRETGDYVLDGAGAEVSAYGEMRVRAENSPLDEFHDSFFFQDAGGSGIPENWLGEATVDSSVGWLGTDGQVRLTIQNILAANTAAFGENAFIQKKSLGVEISINEVPLPAAFWLFGSALIGVFGWRRKGISNRA